MEWGRNEKGIEYRMQEAAAGVRILPDVETEQRERRGKQ